MNLTALVVLVLVLGSVDDAAAAGGQEGRATGSHSASTVALADTGSSGPRAHRIRTIICSVFTGSRCGPAIRVATCETGGTLDPYARGRAGERGLFQIHPVHFGWVDEARLWQPLYNARVAFRLSRGGSSWRAWTCRP